MADSDLDFNSIKEILKENAAVEERSRKKKTDWGQVAVTGLCTSALAIMVGVYALLAMAAPPTEHKLWTSFIYVTFGTVASIRARWDYGLVYIAYVLMLVSLGACVIAFVLDHMYLKKKTGKYRISVFIIGGVTVISFVIYVIRFWYILF